MRGLIHVLLPLLFCFSCSGGGPTEPQDAGVDDGATYLDYTADSAPGCDWAETSRSCLDPMTIWMTAISANCDDPGQDGLTLSLDIPCGQGQACDDAGEVAQCK